MVSEARICLALIPERLRQGRVRERICTADDAAETCARCHPDVVAQWKSSAHRFASFNNPFYDATITDMWETATEPNPWGGAAPGDVPQSLRSTTYDDHGIGLVLENDTRLAQEAFER